MDLEQKVAELKKRNQLAEDGGGAKRRERQHKEGKMSARERVEFLLDEGTFEETDKLVTHRCNDFGMAVSRAAWSTFSRRTLPYSAGRSRKRTRRRSSRSWTWPRRWERR
jgi:hypothetical protein